MTGNNQWVGLIRFALKIMLAAFVIWLLLTTQTGRALLV